MRSNFQPLLTLFDLGSLRSGIQWRRWIRPPDWMWVDHQLPQWDWHIGRWWRTYRGFTWKPLPCSRILPQRFIAFRVWVSTREGLPLLWAQDNVRRICGDTCQKQSLCPRAQHIVHCLRRRHTHKPRSRRVGRLCENSTCFFQIAVAKSSALIRSTLWPTAQVTPTQHFVPLVDLLSHLHSLMFCATIGYGCNVSLLSSVLYESPPSDRPLEWLF